ncbi:MAG: ferritin family protein [Geobacteraceae bacterium]|nr:ferritin family protein [Geobacteraceae bacterium]
MRGTWQVLVGFVAALVIFSAGSLSAQMGTDGMGSGMGTGGYGYCPYCGQQWDGHLRETLTIPESLPQPKNKEWLQKLGEVLSLEKLSKAQYEADSEKYKVNMPYMMVIYQEDNHIAWITKLFAAYGLSSEVRILPLEKSASLEEAYKIAYQLEQDLMPRYEWLIKNAEDKNAAETLNTVLLQTRMHAVMFQHALQMGGGMGPGMGFGMGPGMMYR